MCRHIVLVCLRRPEFDSGLMWSFADPAPLPLPALYCDRIVEQWQERQKAPKKDIWSYKDRIGGSCQGCQLCGFRVELDTFFIQYFFIDSRSLVWVLPGCLFISSNRGEHHLTAICFALIIYSAALVVKPSNMRNYDALLFVVSKISNLNVRHL